MRKSATIQKIRLLRSIKPNKEWSSKTRSILLSQIAAQGSRTQNRNVFMAAKAYGLTFWNDLYNATLGTVLARPRNVFAGAAVLAVVSFFAYTQAQQSLPGEVLYSVKETEENIKVALANPEDLPALELSLIGRRIQEIETLTGRSLEQSDKDQKVEALVQNVSRKLKKVESNLTSIRSQGEPKKVVNIASLVKEKSADYRQVLKQNVATSTPALVNTIDEALATADSAQTKALEVIVDKGKEGGASESEVAAHLTQSIVEVENTAKQLKTTVSMAVLFSATKVLKEAKESVKQKDFKVALRKLTQGKELVSSVESEIGESSASSTPEQDTDIKIKLVF